MEAPEKIIIGKHNITSDGDVVFAWVTDEPDCEAMQHDIEYIRVDAFIEKACEWIKEKWDDSYTMPIIIDSVIEDFKSYMKGK